MDHIAIQLYTHLVKDFQTLLGDMEFGKEALSALTESPKKFREYIFPTLGEVPPYRYKAWWQLANFLKRYRFADDAYTDEELEERTNCAYLETQKRLASVAPWSARTRAVLREARRVCRQILDEPYDTEPHRQYGKRATVACTLRDAFLDLKLTTGSRFTCPTPLLKECKYFLKHMPLGRSVCRELRKTRRSTGSTSLFTLADYLTLTQVPKSWKINRSITPLSEFGLYWSFGVGRYVELCLRKHGLDIRTLADRHKSLAARYSVTRTHVTGDLSSASDSLTRQILNAVLPRKVYTDLRKTFVSTVIVGGRRCYTQSCMPMGNGATFPVETLVFYCLLKAIGNLLKVDGVYSVFGDDLIYPSRIHTYVYRVFGDLGIKFNLEKTFRLSHFRESCGGDYYHGIDVRPALYPERECITSGKQELQHLYKVWNSLRDRWTRTELRSTFDFLEREIFVKSNGKVYFVPKSFPPTAGYRVSRPPKLPWHYQNTFSVGFKNGTVRYDFRCILNEAPPQRDIVQHEIYMRASLRDREIPKIWASPFRNNVKMVRKVFPQSWKEPLKTNKNVLRRGSRSQIVTVLTGQSVNVRVLKWVVRRFLKSTVISGDTKCGNAFPTSEALHVTGKPKVMRVYVSTWA